MSLRRRILELEPDKREKKRLRSARLRRQLCLCLFLFCASACCHLALRTDNRPSVLLISWLHCVL